MPTTELTIDPSLRFEHPRPQNTPHAAVVALQKESASKSAASAASLEEAVELSSRANSLSQQIAASECERTAVQSRIANIESRNFAAEKVQAESTFDRFYGVPGLGTPSAGKP